MAQSFHSQERGVVLLAVMAAILILTLLLSALVLSTIDETSISRQQLGGSQALSLAEAAAYRALADLRHRITVDLDVAIAQAQGEELLALCEAEEGWRLIARFADAAGGDDWAEDPAGGEAVLPLNGGTPLTVLAGGGQEIGRINATIRVRSGRSPNGVKVCERGDGSTPERYEMWFTYEVEASGITARGRRAVRLTNPSDAVLPLLIERAGVSRWALLVLGAPEAWLGDGTVVDGPAHANGQWWISGRPTFRADVDSVAQTVRFGNCGSPIELQESANPGAGTCAGDHPRYQAGQLRLGAPSVTLPANAPNPARAALGLDPIGAEPIDSEIRAVVADQVKGTPGVGEGVYIPNDAGFLRHPETRRPTGIYIKGNVDVLGFVAEESRQAIIIQMAASRTRAGRQWKITLDPQTETLLVEGDKGSATYRGPGNGLVYVTGAIHSVFGTVQRKMRLTVAARRTITVSDHLVYQDPPAAGNAADNLLGLYSQLGDVQIAGSAVPADLYIDAVVLVPHGRFWAKGFDVIPHKGILHLLGSVAQEKYGEVGTLDARSGLRLGYSLVLRHDQRLLQQQTPPFFPLTDRYMSSRPRSDPLYDKPVWEEIPVP